MARHKESHFESETEPQLDISSLIDVCFLLLIYFLVTATIKPREQDLLMALPRPTEGTPSFAIAPMFIRVDAAGAVFSGIGAGERVLDTDPFNRVLPLLSSQLNLYQAASRSAGDEPMVQLYVDASTTQQRVVDVLNALSGEGIVSVTFTDLVDVL